MKKINWGDIILKISLLTGVFFLQTWILQLCWNFFVIGAIDGLNEIGFWQSMGIRVAFNILTLSMQTTNFSSK